MDIPAQYFSQETEKKWLKRFAESPPRFSYDTTKKNFSILMPPPNVTGELHCGHALVSILQDVAIRYHAMKGYNCLWQSGFDHAGIATQSVVEKILLKKGKRRTDYSKEAFVAKIKEFVEEKKDTIKNQLLQLGLFVDLDDARYTLDDRSVDSVIKAFHRLYEDGLIYQGDYLVHWDPETQTALSDEELETEEIATFLWYFNYPLCGEEGHIVVATTRPETMLGDTAIAVPTKSPYKGKKALIPIVDREVRIVSDHMVKEEFGSGAVKITPAHDFRDYDVALRHGLPLINIFTKDGKINAVHREFEGLTIAQARVEIVQRMKKLGLFVKKEPYVQKINVSYRSKAQVEPLLSKQWFVNMQELKKEAPKIAIYPASIQAQYEAWLDNIRDWCISRQLSWGHPIPLWRHRDDPAKIVCQKEYGVLPLEVAKDKRSWVQETDVLDTWFSSALWPIATLLDDPKKNLFYPTSLLITGFDILFFWVTKMALLSSYLAKKTKADKRPFKDVFLHGLLYSKSYRYKNGIYASKAAKYRYDRGEKIPKDLTVRVEKMSKSKNNGIDPLELIAEFGLDAFRFALLNYTSARPMELDIKQLEESKHFMNKLWNAARFVLTHLSKAASLEPARIFYKNLENEDIWIFKKLDHLIEEFDSCIKISYDFRHIAQACYHFFWDDFCSEYLEIAKPFLFGKVAGKERKEQIIFTVLYTFLHLLKPLAPVITEEIFSNLKEAVAHCLPLEGGLVTFPTGSATGSATGSSSGSSIADTYSNIDTLIHTILPAIRNEIANRPVALFIEFSPPSFLGKQHMHIIKQRVNCKNISYGLPANAKKSRIYKIADCSIYLEVAKNALLKQNSSLVKKLEKITKQLISLDANITRVERSKKAEKDTILQRLQTGRQALLAEKSKLESVLDNDYKI